MWNENFLGVLASKIICYDILPQIKFNRKNNKYLFLTEIACFNFVFNRTDQNIYNSYLELVKRLILNENITCEQIEYFSYLYLIKVSLAKTTLEYNKVNNQIHNAYVIINQEVIKSHEICASASQLKSLITSFLKDARISMNKKELDAIFTDIIDHKKIRAIKKKTGKPAKNLVKNAYQFNELKKIYQPKFNILGNKLHYVELMDKNLIIKSKEFDCRNSFEMALNLVLQFDFYKKKQE